MSPYERFSNIYVDPSYVPTVTNDIQQNVKVNQSFDIANFNDVGKVDNCI